MRQDIAALCSRKIYRKGVWQLFSPKKQIKKSRLSVFLAAGFAHLANLANLVILSRG